MSYAGESDGKAFARGLAGVKEKPDIGRFESAVSIIVLAIFLVPVAIMLWKFALQ